MDGKECCGWEGKNRTGLAVSMKMRLILNNMRDAILNAKSDVGTGCGKNETGCAATQFLPFTTTHIFNKNMLLTLT
ncbi:MAG: hypothetical protein PHX69_11500 [Simplicispira sp.]|uniref:hypothetical protein n=1 Tax=Simplicispira sp. TaxID=2015802 RepID=UPI002584588C|nr:hypothetical protein [Simplicispira sp.]MDD2692383.1 hypothetical protein [Simplicispira sp.]